MKTKHFVPIMLLAMMVASSIPIKIGRADPTTISVSPPATLVQPGGNFTIDITLDYAENLYGYEIWLGFDKSVLNATSIQYRGYLNEPTMIWAPPTGVNNTGGYVALSVSTHFPTVAGKTGGSPPPLATVNFTAISAGASMLHLYNTILSDNQANPIQHTTVDGAVLVGGVGAHDVAVTYAACSKTIICQGYTGNITVIVENEGNFSETFNVTVRANTTDIETRAVTLTSGTFKILTIVWNASGFAKGNYSINVSAQLAGDTNPTNNNLTDGWTIVSMVGDITSARTPWVPDGKVDGPDVALIASLFGANYPDQRYKPDADIVYDGKINAKDIALVASKFGQKDP